MNLKEIIIERIKKEGPISFHDFMEMALYHPGHGYYSSSGNQFGKDGDFYTSTNLMPVFGALLARQLHEVWEMIGETELTVVEYGAGAGTLCYDILEYLNQHSDSYQHLRYCIIEKSAALREKQKSFLKDKVSWFDSIEEIGHFNGCVISNELIDNFAVHQVVMEKQLMEVFVDYNDGFKEILLPAKPELISYFEEQAITLPEGYRTEVNLEAKDWIGNIAHHLDKGCVITVDYGYLAEELYNNRHRDGTLLSYYKHTMNDSFYENIGKQDITSHINFSAIINEGEKHGLKNSGIVSQAEFLLALGFKEYLAGKRSASPDIMKAVMEESLLTRTLLIDMGTKFKVLIQHKSLDGKKFRGLASINT